MNTVPAPKDLNLVKNRFVLGLTKRQVICFGIGAALGVPTYFLTRSAVGNSIAALLLLAVCFPFFLLGMYERDGQPAEQVLYYFIKHRFLTPGIRTYQTENTYSLMLEYEEKVKEVEELEERSKGFGKKSSKETFKHKKEKRKQE